jgi:Glycosyltransferase family 10 (fucosyltransferase) C-term
MCCKFLAGVLARNGFIKHLLNVACDSFICVANQAEADIVITTSFITRRRRRHLYRPPKGFILYPEKMIAIIHENERPNYRQYRYSLSSDFDSYGGRNCRLPWWYLELNWPGMVPSQRVRPPGNPHGFEPPVDIDILLQPRSETGSADRELFCCLVASNPEPHRMFCAEELSRIGRVDYFGKIAGTAHESSKYELLPRYRFNLCFENSTFPGYYTEKLLQAWVAGCVPLYYSDPWFAVDFNPNAVINRANFQSVSEFVDYVNSSRKAIAEIVNRPLLNSRPTLDASASFLRKAATEIVSGSRATKSKSRIASIPYSLWPRLIRKRKQTLT